MDKRALIAFASLLAACDATSSGPDSGLDAGVDAALPDAGRMDAARPDGALADAGADAATDAAPLDGGPPPLAIDWRWEWVNPRPQGNTLDDVSLASPTEGWAVGRRGTALHLREGRWELVATPTTEALLAVHAIDANDAWAVGERGVILRWNGARWVVVPSGVTSGLHGVWATGPDFAIAVGEERILRWDGTRWTAVDPGLPLPSYLGAVDGVDESDFWVVGGYGAGDTIFHCVDGAWSATEGPVIEAWNDVDVRAADDAWVVGDDQRVAHWDGAAWTEQTLPGGGTMGTWYDSVYAAAINDVWVASQWGILRFDGTSWRVVHDGGLWQITGVGSDVVAVGIGGRLAHRVGDVLVDDWTDAVRSTLEAVYAASPDDVWIGSRASAERVLRWDGTSIAPPSDSSLRAGGVMAIDGTGSTDVFFVGHRGYVAHWDGSSGAVVQPPISDIDLQDVVALEPGRALAVGYSGTILELTRTSVTPHAPITTAVLEGVWAAAPDDVFAVGWNGTILRYDGATWSPMESGVTTTLYDVVGRAPDDVWAVGERGLVLHFDGTAWRTIESGTTTSFHAIADAGDALWLVGMEEHTGAGEVWRWDGTRLIEDLPGTSGWFNDIAALPDGELWTVGFNGQVLRRRPD